MKRPALVHAMVALAVMLLTAAAARFLTPNEYLADLRGPISLSTVVPLKFGDWRVDVSAPAMVVNPVQEETLSRIYSEMLTRTYVNSNGDRVMLSVTYGRDQRADRAAHYPEVCYPAQGFEVRSNRVNSLNVGTQPLPVRLLETSLNDRRLEPVTYWTTIGEFNSLGGFGKRLIELRYGLNGVVPDGILFRVSTIGRDSQAEFVRQGAFIESLLLATQPDQRIALTGKPAR